MSINTLTFEQDDDLPDLKHLHAYITKIATMVCPKGGAYIDALQASYTGFDSLQSLTNWTVESFGAKIEQETDWETTKTLLQQASFDWVIYAGQKRTAYSSNIKFDASSQHYTWTMPVWSDASDGLKQVIPWLTAIAKAYRYPVVGLLDWMTEYVANQGNTNPPQTWLKRHVPGEWSIVESKVGPTTLLGAFEWTVPKTEIKTLFALWKHMHPWTQRQQSYGCILQTSSLAESWPNGYANLLCNHAPVETLHTLDQSQWHSITGVVEFEEAGVEASMPFFWQSHGFEIRLVMSVDDSVIKHQALIDQLQAHLSLVE